MTKIHRNVLSLSPPLSHDKGEFMRDPFAQFPVPFSSARLPRRLAEVNRNSERDRASIHNLLVMQRLLFVSSFYDTDAVGSLRVGNDSSLFGHRWRISAGRSDFVRIAAR
ncbi:hypothetical protein BaRGS_00019781 [Batillaria attramentaria]|uniref:Uncharacterized protein n=1 Tax=Batillaria attramentaria TaxID=370345 RepID=A0ABD0KPA8_9CAEN